ncbi:hypothetical protein [Cyclobacterium plantarum]
MDQNLFYERIYRVIMPLHPDITEAKTDYSYQKAIYNGWTCPSPIILLYK